MKTPEEKREYDRIRQIKYRHSKETPEKRARRLEYQRNYNKAHPESLRKYRSYNPEKIKAHDIMYQAIKCGSIFKPSYCSSCGTKIYDPKLLHGHHEDYSKPLEVVWLCYPCHGATRRKK